MEESGGNGMEKVWREENNQPVVPERKYEDHPDKKRKDETVKRANRKKKGGKEKGAEGVDQKIKKATDRNRSSGRGRNRKTDI